MQFLFELAPVIAFVVAYVVGGIYAATATIMSAMAVVLRSTICARGAFRRCMGLSAVLVWVFGAATLILHDIRFIQWKPTVFYWLVAIVLPRQHVDRQAAAAPDPHDRRAAKAPMAAERSRRFPTSSWRRANLLFVAVLRRCWASRTWCSCSTPARRCGRNRSSGFVVVLFVFTSAQFFWLMRKQLPEQAPSPQA